MVQCFAPDCNHQSERETCKFYRFPKSPSEFERWKKLLRRQDRAPGSNSRVCSCHFRDELKVNGPEIFKRNADKFFPTTEVRKPKIAKKVKPAPENPSGLMLVSDIVEQYYASAASTSRENNTETPTREVLLQIEVENLRKEVKDLKIKGTYQREVYSVLSLKDEVICMETGLTNKDIFLIVVNFVRRFSNDIDYYYGWKVDKILLEDQVFITLMKVRQNYTNLHLAELFHCSTSTISNIILTFVHVLCKLLYEDCLKTVPSREKNRTSMPESFSLFGHCKMIIDCTDIEVAAPGLMSEQKLIYSTYRGMNSFKTLIGVAPNAVITYVSKLFPGSTSDKAIVEKSGVLHHFEAGDLILADKGYLITDILPPGVSVNIPQFLYNGKFNSSEIKLTKTIARCRIHVERANARLKDFKILSFIPPYLRCYSETLLKLCAGLVNLQNSLIREIRDTVDLT
ncbi:uncharacterized protein LOC135685039 [Rhopilema esculentum]|uniref:uncharacterized protein LOC135685039 n=2 Tax=Rhopilema esculentum TaxID=499914 RepID=UPI0031E3ABBE|eukprot:gene17086-8603_t